MSVYSSQVRGYFFSHLADGKSNTLAGGSPNSTISVAKKTDAA